LGSHKELRTELGLEMFWVEEAESLKGQGEEMRGKGMKKVEGGKDDSLLMVE
jgi:hypothetical protein